MTSFSYEKQTFLGVKVKHVVRSYKILRPSFDFGFSILQYCPKYMVMFSTTWNIVTFLVLFGVAVFSAPRRIYLECPANICSTIQCAPVKPSDCTGYDVYYAKGGGCGCCGECKTY